MVPSADAKFNYAALPAEKAASARAAAERIKGRMQLAAESIVEVGRELIQQKKDLGHGNFLAWIETEFGMSDQTARNMMRVADLYGDKIKSVLDLPATALYALAAPSTPEPVRTEALERASRGEKVTAKDVEVLKKKLAKAESEKENNYEKAQIALVNAQEAYEQRDKAQNEVLFLKADKERLARELEDMREEQSRLADEGTIHVYGAPPSSTPEASLMVVERIETIVSWWTRRQAIIEKAAQMIREMHDEGMELFTDATPPVRMGALGRIGKSEDQFLDDLANPVTL